MFIQTWDTVTHESTYNHTNVSSKMFFFDTTAWVQNCTCVCKNVELEKMNMYIVVYLELKIIRKPDDS